MRDYNSPEYVAWRNAVFKRDGYKCQSPGCGSKKGLQAHHIERYADNPLLRFVVDNGITLCKPCHRKTFGREAEFAPMFKQLLSKGAFLLKIWKIMYGD